MSPRYKWSRLVACVARHVGSAQLAERYVALARNGGEPYKTIIAEAFELRHRSRYPRQGPTR